MHRVVADRRRWALIGALGLLSVLPVLRATLVQLRGDPVLFTDYAVIATRARDLWDGHLVLTGQTSLLPGPDGQVLHGLGPMQSWLLGPAAWSRSPALLLAAMAAAAVACFLASIAIAQRIAGWPGALVVALAVVLVQRAVGPYQLISLWNVWDGIPLLVLATVACLALAVGRGWSLPVLLVGASGAAQMHLTFVLPSLFLVAAGLVGYWWRPGALRREASPEALDAPDVPDATGRTPMAWRSAGIVSLVLWWPLLVNEVRTRPSNLAGIVRAGLSNPGPTSGAAAEYVGRDIVPVPRGFKGVRGSEVTLTWGLGQGLGAWLPLIGVLALLAGGYALSRSCPVIRRAAVVTAGLVVSSVLALQGDANPFGAFTDYAMDWTAWTSALVPLVLVGAAATWTLRRVGQKWGPRVTRAGAALLVAVVVVVGLVADPSDPHAHVYPSLHRATELARRHTEPGGRYLVEATDLDAQNVSSTLLFDLVSRGRVVIYGAGGGHPMDHHQPSGRRCDAILWVSHVPGPVFDEPGTLGLIEFPELDGDPSPLLLRIRSVADTSPRGRC